MPTRDPEEVDHDLHMQVEQLQGEVRALKVLETLNPHQPAAFITSTLKNFLDDDDLTELNALWEKNPKVTYQDCDCSLLKQMYGTRLMKKLPLILPNYLCIEAWFINADGKAMHEIQKEKTNGYDWHFDMHVGVFGSTVRNIWIPLTVSDKPGAVLEYQTHRLSDPSFKKLLLYNFCFSKNMAKLSCFLACFPATIKKYFFGHTLSRTAEICDVEVGDVFVLDPTSLHRTGPRPKRALALQCIPISIARDSEYGYAMEGLYDVGGRKRPVTDAPPIPQEMQQQIIRKTLAASMLAKELL